MPGSGSVFNLLHLQKATDMQFNFQEFLTLTFTLFAVIDVVGSVPMLISLKEKMGGINAWKVTLISGALMVLFFFIGKPFLNILGVDIKSFAVAGSIVIFILGLEMVLGIEFFKSEKECTVRNSCSDCISINCRKWNTNNHHVA